jgi:Uma2 family endonuclease
MATASLIPLSEYLSTTYRPDRDFLEGELLERNIGEQPHARIQNFFGYIFRLHREDWNVRALAEQRVQVRADRYRIPDITVVDRTAPADLILQAPPLLCIEVLSSSDSLRSIKARVDDYAAMGVPHIWVVDPWSREAYYASPRGFQQPEDGHLRIPNTPIDVALAEVFAELDEA